jgi:FMN-dependent NADH-azoreductase
MKLAERQPLRCEPLVRKRNLVSVPEHSNIRERLPRQPPLLPQITAEWVQAIPSDPATLTADQKQVLEVSDALVAELVEADTIVIGAPMYTFAIPAPLKA